MILKIEDITTPGFYWNRADEHRDWTMVYVARLAKNPAHHLHNTFRIDGRCDPICGDLFIMMSEHGMFIGPIEAPAKDLK